MRERRLKFRKCLPPLFNTFHIPPRSPDLIPVERFWAWLRRHLRKLDLQDAMATPPKPSPSKAQYRARIRAVLKSKKAQQVAGNMTRGLRKVCKLIVKNKGAHRGE